MLPMLQPASTSRWCCGRSRSGRTASPPASSTSRWSAPSSTARMRQSEIIEIAGGVKERENEARFPMLEQLADYDDELMEQLLADMQPPRDKVFADLAQELRDGLIVPGAARLGRERQRHPAAAEGAAPRGAGRRDARRGASKLENAKSARAGDEDDPHRARRQAVDGRACWPASSATARSCRAPTAEERAAPAFSHAGPGGREARRRPRPARRWRWAGSRRSDSARRCRRRQGRRARRSRRPSRPQPVYGIAHRLKERKDEVKLTAALGQADGGGSLARARARQDTARDGAVGPGRDASARRRSSGCKRKYGVRCRAASRRAGPLQGDDPQGVADARPPQEAVGRPRPVRRRGARHQAAAARLGLRVRRDDHRRRGAAPVHPVGRDRRARLPEARAAAASRWSTWR